MSYKSGALVAELKRYREMFRIPVPNHEPGVVANLSNGVGRRGICLACGADTLTNLGGYCNACTRRIDERSAARRAEWQEELRRKWWKDSPA
jgi:predicted amidophosphoribosyltransferase